MSRVRATSDMDVRTFRRHMKKRHPGVSPMDHSRDHANRPQDHTHTAGRPKVDSYQANHVRAKKLFGPASEYQCLLCFDPAADWAHLWRTHPDPTDPWSYVPMCKQDHTDYDHEARSKASKRNWQSPEFRARISEAAREQALRQWSDPEHRVKFSATRRQTLARGEYQAKLSEQAKRQWQRAKSRGLKSLVKEEAGMEAALEELRHHWGSAYVIGHPEPDVWVAQRRDDRVVLRADTPEELRDRIIADYTARPVPRQGEP